MKTIAQRIAAELGVLDGVTRVSAAPNGYLNVSLDRPSFLLARLTGVAPAPRRSEGKAIVEHTAINPNKAAHIGHLRNATLGDTLRQGTRRRSAAILVVGRVAALREHLRWYDSRPLFGKRVLVTRPREQAAAMVDRLAAYGAESVEVPMIRLAPPEDPGPLLDAVARVHDFDWVVFTSANAVETVPGGILASAFFAYASGYAEAATLLPGKAYWVKALAPGLLIVSSTSAMAVTHTGEATYYTFADGSGNCMFPATPSDLMVGAMNQTEYDNSNICGACATVTGQSGTIDIRIVDRCPECAPGDIDLSPQAFALIAPIELGRVPISWHLRPCGVTGPIEYHFKDGANQWWTAVQIRNHRNPIAQFEYQVRPGLWKVVPRVSYNYFVEGSGMGPGPYTFRVTDIFGNVLTDTAIPLLPDASYPGAAQFP